MRGMAPHSGASGVTRRTTWSSRATSPTRRIAGRSWTLPATRSISSSTTRATSPLPSLAWYPLTGLARVYEVNVLAPLGLIQLALPRLKPGAVVINITSDAAVEAYETWGGYGSSKAALEQLTATLAAEHPELRVYAVDPGDMRTQMQQDAFPGEDISDRPPPEESVPGLLTLIEGSSPSGRYRARELAGVEE